LPERQGVEHPWISGSEGGEKILERKVSKGLQARQVEGKEGAFNGQKLRKRRALLRRFVQSNGANGRGSPTTQHKAKKGR